MTIEGSDRLDLVAEVRMQYYKELFKELFKDLFETFLRCKFLYKNSLSVQLSCLLSSQSLALEITNLLISPLDPDPDPVSKKSTIRNKIFKV